MEDQKKTEIRQRFVCRHLGWKRVCENCVTDTRMFELVTHGKQKYEISFYVEDDGMGFIPKPARVISFFNKIYKEIRKLKKEQKSERVFVVPLPIKQTAGRGENNEEKPIIRGGKTICYFSNELVHIPVVWNDENDAEFIRRGGNVGITCKIERMREKKSIDRKFPVATLK